MPDPSNTFLFTIAVKNLATDVLKDSEKLFTSLGDVTGKVAKGLGLVNDAQLDMLKTGAKELAATVGKGLLPTFLLGKIDKLGFGKESKLAMDFLTDLNNWFKQDFGKSLGDVLKMMTTMDAKGVVKSLLAGFAKVQAVKAFVSVMQMAVDEAFKLNDAVISLRQEFRMSTKEAADLGDSLVDVALSTGSSIEESTEAARALAKVNLGGAKNMQEYGALTLKMSQAWGVGVQEVAEFEKTANKIYGVGPAGLMKVGSAFDYIGRTSAMSRRELMEMSKSLEPIMLRIPKTLRSKVAPDIMATMGAISAEFKDMGMDPQFVVKKLEALKDPLNAEGRRLQSMIIATGGTTAKQLSEAIEKNDPSAIFEAQVKGIQNMKKQIGDERFTRNITAYASAWGMTADEVQRISEMDPKALHDRIAVSREELKNQEGFNKGWDDFTASIKVFKEKIANVFKAFLQLIGKPVFYMLNAITTGLNKFLGLFDKVSPQAKKAAGLAIGLAGVALMVWKVVSGWAAWVAWIKGGILWLSTFETIGGSVISAWTAFEAVLATIGAALGPIVLAVGAIVGVSILLYQAWQKNEAAFDRFFERAYPIFKKLGLIIAGFTLVVNSWLIPFVAIGAAIYSLYKYWDDFYKLMEPGLKDLSDAWDEILDAVGDVMNELSDAMGPASDDTWDLEEAFRFVAQAIGAVVGALATMVSWVVRASKPLIKLVGDYLQPTFELLGAIFNPKKPWADNIVENLENVAIAVLKYVYAPFIAIYKHIKSFVEDTIKLFHELVYGGSPGIIPYFKEAAVGIVKIFSSIWEAIKSTFSGFLDFIKDGLAGLAKSLVNAIPGGSWLSQKLGLTGDNVQNKADGGIVTKPQTVHVGEGGQPEAIVPLSKMQQAAKDFGAPQQPGGQMMSMDEVISAIKHLEDTIVKISKSSGAAAMVRTGGF